MPVNPDVEKNQAVELAKARAKSKRQKQGEDTAKKESRPPKTEEAELIPQEYGMPLETGARDEGVPEEDEETEGEEPEDEEPEEQESEPEEQDEMATLSKAQMRKITKIQRTIADQEKKEKKERTKKEKELKNSKEQDRTKNAARLIKIIMGWGATFWWLLLIPLLLAIFATLTIAILVWGCGLNLGGYSLKTKSLKNKFKNEKKAIEKRKKERIKKFQKIIEKIIKK